MFYKNIIVAIGILTFVCILNAQVTNVNYYKVPVTYYDFHTDGSNSDFFPSSIPYNQFSGLATDSGLGAVTTNLIGSAIKYNPLSANTNAHFWKNVARWYVSWSAGRYDTLLRGGSHNCTFIPKDTIDDTMWLDRDANDFVILPKTIYDSTCVDVAAGQVISDTAYKNVTILDSIKFLQVSTGSSYYKYGGADKTYPLDGLGFGNEGESHNNGYTIKIHNQFIYHATDSIALGSDDGVWLYVNDTLVIDRSGFHSYVVSGTKLDDLGLTEGQTYNFDIFFAERYLGGNLSIEVNFPFVNMVTGTDSSTTPVRYRAGSTNYGIGLKNNRLVKLSSATTSVKVTVCYPNGKVVTSVRQNTTDIRTLDLNTIVPKTNGIVFVQVICIDKSGRSMETIVRKIVQAQ